MESSNSYPLGRSRMIREQATWGRGDYFFCSVLNSMASSMAFVN